MPPIDLLEIAKFLQYVTGVRFCINFIFGWFQKPMQKKHKQRSSISLISVNTERTTWNDPFQKKFTLDQTITALSTALSLKHFSKMFLSYFWQWKPKGKQKINLFETTLFKRIDDDLFLLDFLCCCSFNIYAKEHRNNISCVVGCLRTLRNLFILKWCWILFEINAKLESNLHCCF